MNQPADSLPSALASAARRDLSQRDWLVVLSGYMLTMIAFGLACQPWAEIGAGWLRVLRSPGILLSDYVAIGGPGAALVNAGLVGLAGLFLARFSGAPLSGPTIAAVFTMAGFGLFGKNVLTIWPVMAGVALFSRVTGHPFRRYLLVALFGTALSPLVSQVAFGFGLGLWPGLLFGVAIGFLLPPLAVYMLRLHQGFNLYNVGLTCGFVGLFVTALFESVGLPSKLPLQWSTEHSDILRLALFIYVASMLALGLYLAKGLKGLRQLAREVGVLPSDYVVEHGAGAVLINMGLIGLLGWAYIWLVGGDYNGPTIGGVLTMVGFAAFGKHIVNAPPVMFGVYLASRVMIWQPSQAGPLLAALFATTLAPLSGRYGPLVGMVAGAIHLTIVMRTAPWFGGLNLYNNGFAGGLTATLLVGLIGWWEEWRQEHRREG